MFWFYTSHANLLFLLKKKSNAFDVNAFDTDKIEFRYFSHLPKIHSNYKITSVVKRNQ